MRAGGTSLQKLDKGVMRFSNGYQVEQLPGTSFSLEGAYRLRCVPHCVKKQKNNSTAAGPALEPDSLSTLERYVGNRSGGLR